MKATGTALLLLAAVGIFSSWSAMTQAADGGTYVIVNALLVLAGVALLVAGARRKRVAASSLPPDTTPTP